ncbi:MAG: class I SAM-dependent methyltransferase [Candidatus Binataceae bacterium]
MPPSSPPDRCIFCESTSPVFWQTKAADGDEYNVWRCTECGSGFVWPRPTETRLASFYLDSDDYCQNLTHMEADARYHPTSSQEAEAVLKKCGTLTGGRRLLDVGAGRGTYSCVALRQGFKVDAIEPNESARQKFKELNGFLPQDGFLDEYVEASNKPYDVLLLSHVLEHIADPERTAAQLYALTAPDGLVAIAVPHFGSLLSRIQGRNDMFVCPPEHLNFFSKRGLAMLLERNGYRLRHIETTSKVPKYRIQTVLRVRLLASAGWRSLYLAMRLADRCRLGMTITAYFQKPAHDSAPQQMTCPRVISQKLFASPTAAPKRAVH